MAEKQKNIRTKKQSMMVATLKRLKKNRLAVCGLVIISIMALLAVFAPLIAPYPYELTDVKNAFAGPSSQHLFGTDELGRDILSRIIYGGRYSLRIGILAVAGAATVGIALGSAAGFYGGAFDTVLMRILDVFQAIPGLILGICIGAVLGPGINNCILSLMISSMPNYARMTRASILKIRGMEYIEAAGSINCSDFRTIVKHILPNAISPLIVQMTMGVASAILVAASLSFVGLGVQPPDPEWGAMLSAGRNYIRNYPHLVVFPGLTIMVAILSLNMLGDGLRDALDPKLKN